MTKGHPVYIPAIAYHMDDCDIHLLSPQSYFKLYGGDTNITAHKVVIRLLDDHVVNIPINTALNLPVISSLQPTLEEQDKYGPHLLSSFVANIWTYLLLPSLFTTNRFRCHKSQPLWSSAGACQLAFQAAEASHIG